LASPESTPDEGGAGGIAGNRLLEALPSSSRLHLTGLMTPVVVPMRTVLFEPGQAIRSVDFPRGCVETLVTPTRDGRTVEVASVGSDGILGVPLVPGGSLAVRAVCSVTGVVDRIDATAFADLVAHDVHLRELVDDYRQSLFNRLSTTVACNRLHTTRERLARWLLTSADQTGASRFATTFGFLGQLLGCSETAAARSAQALQEAGLISLRRGRITIVDAARLRMASCECYLLIKREADGVVQKALVRTLVLTDS